MINYTVRPTLIRIKLRDIPYMMRPFILRGSCSCKPETYTNSLGQRLKINQNIHQNYQRLTTWMKDKKTKYSQHI